MGNSVALAGRVPVSVQASTHALDLRVASGLRSLFAQPAEDRGDAFVLTHLRSNLDPATVRLVLVLGDRLMAVYARRVTEMPYSHAPAILLRTLHAGKHRSVHH
jgi:hypothetical protein